MIPASTAFAVASSPASPRAVATTAAARPGARPHRVRRNADADLCPASAAPLVASRVAVSRDSCPCAWLMNVARSGIWPISVAASSAVGSRRASSASAASRADCSGKHIFESSHLPPTKWRLPGAATGLDAGRLRGGSARGRRDLAAQVAGAGHEAVPGQPPGDPVRVRVAGRDDVVDVVESPRGGLALQVVQDELADACTAPGRVNPERDLGVSPLRIQPAVAGDLA